MKKSTPKKTVKTARKTVKKVVKKTARPVAKKVTPASVSEKKSYGSSLSPFQVLLWLSIIFSSILIIVSKL